MLFEAEGRMNGWHKTDERYSSPWAYDSGPEVIKLFSWSTQQSTKSILLINVKMPTIVSFLTFISRIKATTERLKARNFLTFQYVSYYEQLQFRAQLSWAWKKFYNLWAWWAKNIGPVSKTFWAWNCYFFLICQFNHKFWPSNWDGS